MKERGEGVADCELQPRLRIRTKAPASFETGAETSGSAGLWFEMIDIA